MLQHNVRYFFKLLFISQRSRSLYVVPPSVCLSSVTFVHPTQAFGSVFTPFGTLAICDLSIKNFTEIVPSQGYPSVGGGG